MRHFLHELTYLEALYINGEAKNKARKNLKKYISYEYYEVCEQSDNLNYNDI